ncbi:hypothetical protein JTB14_003129 [Gonioctena quinquepunctata]|nr:hypothetical protein JTB14_003129 [Gonioctena quinquepunctata]
MSEICVFCFKKQQPLTLFTEETLNKCKAIIKNSFFHTVLAVGDELEKNVEAVVEPTCSAVRESGGGNESENNPEIDVELTGSAVRESGGGDESENNPR